MRELLTYLPQNNREDPPRVVTADKEDREDSALAQPRQRSMQRSPAARARASQSSAEPPRSTQAS